MSHRLGEIFGGEIARHQANGARKQNHSMHLRSLGKAHAEDYRSFEPHYPHAPSLEWLSLIYFLYSLLLGTAFLLTLPYWLFQMLRHGKYARGLAEKLGRIPTHLQKHAASPEISLEASASLNQHIIWVHAVSVGEVIAVNGLVAALRSRFPDYRVLVTTTTDTGQEMARKQFGEENVFCFPIDFVFAIRPYLRTLRPELVVIAETEFWPNFLHLAHECGARVAIVNARISDRSWPNYRRFRWALRHVLSHVDLFLAQTAEDAQRLSAIGAEKDRIRTTGNLKFDAAFPEILPIVEKLRRSLAEACAAPVLVCGSTTEGEEPLLLRAFASVLSAYPQAAMILAPRHPERFASVAALLKESGKTFWRRSSWQGEKLSGGVLLIDTIGELASLYALADIAFVGGSLVRRGGHNIIEPAQHGAAILVGEHTENFRDIVDLFRSRDAVRIVSAADFSLVLMDLLAHPEKRKALGRRAAETIQSQTGATRRTLDAIQTLLPASASSEPWAQLR
jgi:3-deoxy-D-manno-octulosonic-acid transferase